MTVKQSKAKRTPTKKGKRRPEPPRPKRDETNDRLYPLRNERNFPYECC